MSALVALSSKLPGDREVNGLDALHEEIVSNPNTVICAFVWLDVPKITIDTEQDDPDKAQRPTVRVRKIEPFGTADKVPASVVELMTQLAEARLGHVPLPFDEIRPERSHVQLVRQDGFEDPSDEELEAERKEAAEADGVPLAAVLDPFGKNGRKA